jgi:hypothetical protein
MKQPYGKYQRGKAKPSIQPAASVIVEIHGRHTLEQFSLELQKAVARLQERGAFGIEECRFTINPLDEKGVLMALHNADGEAMTRIDIGAPPPDPPYRPGT